MDIQLCYIKKEYFIEHKDFVKMLDTLDFEKQSKRTHLSIKIADDYNTYYIPLRNNLGKPLRPYGIIGHSVPSKSRPNAGLDYRYTLIINDEKYIECPDNLRIPLSQFNRINNDYEIIKKEFFEYIRKFKKAMRKNRISKEPLFRESSLINFINELL